MKKRLLALLLVLVMGLSLAACSAPAADDPESPSDSSNPTETPDPIVADLSQDVLTFAAGDLAKEASLVTVNGQPVSTSLFLYWLALNCSYFENQYYYYGYTVQNCGDEILNMLLSDTTTTAAYYELLSQKVLEHGCPLTDEQLDTINTSMDVGGADHEMRKALYGLSEEDLMFIYSVPDLYSNLMGALIPAPTTEDLNNYAYQAKHILIKIYDTDAQATVNEDGSYSYPLLDEATVAEKTDLANSILAQLQAAGSQEELETLFDQLMKEHSEDGRDENGDLYSPEGYTTTTGKMVAEFEQAALALEPGQISGLVESVYGYHIILRGEVEDIESYAEDYTTAKMDALSNQWLADAEIVTSEALETLNVADFYTRFLTWQEAYVAKNLPVEEK